MTTQEAIKFLQQLYPVGGHCWLDEQRIEAIGMAIKALQEESANRTPADIKAAKGNTDKCKGCNNVKGCLTCVDGDQWAHIEEARTELVKEGNETPFITLCKEDESGLSLQFCIYGRLVSDYRITKPNARFLNHLLDAYLAKYDTDKYEFDKDKKELGKGETKYNLRGIIPARPIPSIKKIVDSLTPEDMEEAKRELEGVTEGTSLRQL